MTQDSINRVDAASNDNGRIMQRFLVLHATRGYSATMSR